MSRARVSWVVYHLHKISGNFVWNVDGTHRFGSSRWKISGMNGNSKKVLFFPFQSSKWTFRENRVPFTHSYQFQFFHGQINHCCEPYLNGKFDLYILTLARTGAEIAIYL